MATERESGEVGPAGHLVIDFGILHDQVGPPKRNGRLVISGSTVAAVLPRDAPVAGTPAVIQARCVIPGLVNAHAHQEQDGQPDAVGNFARTTPVRRAMIAAQQARSTLEAGVTSVRDLGSSHGIAIELRDAINAGTLPGPNIVAAGRVICMTGGHGAFAGREADGPWDVRRAVREQHAVGADCIKLIATGGVLTPGAIPAREQLTYEELRAGVEEAHRHGMRCAAHAIAAAGIVNAVRAGVDSVEHGHLIDAEGIKLMIDRGTFLVPTLAAVRGIVDAPADAGIPASVLSKANALADQAERNLRRARDAGVRVAAGSDAGTPFNFHDRYSGELGLMQTMLDMTPTEALRAATVDAAALLGLDRGTLGPGDVADLVVLGHDIDQSHAFDAPALVVKAGTVVYRSPS
jgi:imidazolonepropionase-like amidohydrolase